MQSETTVMFVVKNATKKGATAPPFKSVLQELNLTFQTHPASTVVNFFKATGKKYGLG